MDLFDQYQKRNLEKHLKSLFDFTVEDFRKIITLSKYIGSQTDLTFPDLTGTGYQYILAEDFFENLSHVKSITISKDVFFEFREKMFAGCKSLEAIHIVDPTERYYSVDGILYENESKFLVYYPPCKKESVLKIPEGTRKIAGEVEFPRTLKEIHLPASVFGIQKKYLTRPIAFYVEGNPMMLNDSMDSLIVFWNLMEATKEKWEKLPLHVTKDAEILIHYAYDDRVPIYISDGEVIEFRPDGRPECRILTQVIEGTDTLEVTGVVEMRDTLCIPSEYEGKRVVKIKEKTFQWKSGIKTLVLPETLEEIGESAFEETEMEMLIIPKSVKKIGAGAFEGCKHLREVVFQGNVCEIGNYAFQDCAKLCKVQLPKELILIPKAMFHRCDSLQEIVLPETVREIREDAFRGCTALEHINIPKGCLQIKSGAFMDSKIRELVLPEGIEQVSWHLCHNCRKLERLYLPDTIHTIDGYAFAGCSALTRVTLPKQLKHIGESVWRDNIRLQDVIGNPVVDFIGEDAFENTPFLYHPSREFVIFGNHLLRYNGSSRRVVISENVNVIEKKAFSGCTNLQEVVLAKQDIMIGENAFQGTKALDDSQDPFVTFQNMLVSYNGLDQKIALPDNIVRILPGAFQCEVAKCLKHLVLNRTIVRLEKRTLHQCDWDSILVPPNVTEIEADAFYISYTTHGSGTEKEDITAEVKNVRQFICCPGSAGEAFAKKYAIPVTLVSPEEIYQRIQETQENYVDARLTKCIRAGSVIDKHPLLPQLENEVDFEKAVDHLEQFVGKHAAKNMLESLFACLHPRLAERRGLLDRESNWAAIATTTVFLSQFGYLTGTWFHLPDEKIMPQQIYSLQPILECYHYMKNHGYTNEFVKNRLSMHCVYCVTVVNEQLWKQAWQQPGNYIKRLYKECSEAKKEEALIVYNVLMGVLAELAEMQI